MGHYDSDYEAVDEKARKEQKTKRVKALKHLKDALEYAEYASETDFYKQKVREAIYWLENDLG